MGERERFFRRLDTDYTAFTAHLSPLLMVFSFSIIPQEHNSRNSFFFSAENALYSGLEASAEFGRNRIPVELKIQPFPKTF